MLLKVKNVTKFCHSTSKNTHYMIHKIELGSYLLGYLHVLEPQVLE